MQPKSIEAKTQNSDFDNGAGNLAQSCPALLPSITDAPSHAKATTLTPISGHRSHICEDVPAMFLWYDDCQHSHASDCGGFVYQYASFSSVFDYVVDHFFLHLWGHLLISVVDDVTTRLAWVQNSAHFHSKLTLVGISLHGRPCAPIS